MYYKSIYNLLFATSFYPVPIGISRSSPNALIIPKAPVNRSVVLTVSKEFYLLLIKENHKRPLF